MTSRTDSIFLFETIKYSQSRDDEFGVIEITVDAKGDGEGVAIPAAQLSLNEDGVLEVKSRPHQYGPHELVKVEVKDLK